MSMEFQGTRRPAVAGLFYPDDPQVLAQDVDQLLAAARGRVTEFEQLPKAIIAPHAGYPYSGEVAASAYSTLTPGRESIRRVVLIGPSHRHRFDGLALPSAAEFATPLGAVPLDLSAAHELMQINGIHQVDEAHRAEHSLEVQLPFLQRLLHQFEIVPLVFGRCQSELIAAVIESLWGGAETCFVISSDLSHYHPDAVARMIDSDTAWMIEQGDLEQLTSDRACGSRAIQGLLQAAKKRSLRLRQVDLRNSGQTAGGPDRVVGYGAFVALPVAPTTGRTSIAAAVHADANGGARVELTEPSSLLAEDQQLLLLETALSALTSELRYGTPADFSLETFPDELRAPQAAFVTLKRSGRLRGCMGTLQPQYPLVQSIAISAGNAAFRDPRFSPLQAAELHGLDLHLSLLSAPVPWDVPDEPTLIQQLQPGIDGLILSHQGRSSVFLPAVWKELPDPGEFVRRLKMKGGWPADYWSAEMQAQRFTVDSINGRMRSAT